MNNFLTIYKKEIKDIFRDKKTLFFTIFLPIIIYPLMFGIMNFAMNDTKDSVSKEFNIGIRDTGNSSVSKLLSSQPGIKIDTGDDLDEKIKKGSISLILEVPEDFDKKVNEEKQVNIKMIFDDESNKSMMGSEMIKGILDEYYKNIVNMRMAKRGIDKTILDPFVIEKVNTANKKDADNIGTIIAGILPTILIILMFSPTMSMAPDLGAGEKERGTLEPLLSTAVKRSSILWGKLVALATIAFLNLGISLAAIAVSMKVAFKDGAIALTPGSLIVMGIFSIFLLIAVCSIEMAVSIYAKSMKEAGSLMTGVFFPVMMLSYVPYMMDAKTIKFIYFNIPVVNAISVMKEATVGIYNGQHLAIVVAWHLVYMFVAVMVARYVFSKEEVVFRS